MQAELHAPLTLIYSFLLVLARIGGAFVFVPLPGMRNGPDAARIILILAVTICLFPVWPVLAQDPSGLAFAGWVMVEAAFGLSVGLLVGFLADTAIMFGQLCGVHAGFSFVQTIDPESQADSQVLSTIAQTLAALLFVTLGLHRYVIRIFALSLETHPPAQMFLNPRAPEVLIHAATGVFSVGFRLALPIIALLVMVDVTFSLLGRINPNLQILNFSMPLKMLAALAMIAMLVMLVPAVYTSYAQHMLELAAALVR